jgi:hypothetical protein
MGHIDVATSRSGSLVPLRSANQILLQPIASRCVSAGVVTRLFFLCALSSRGEVLRKRSLRWSVGEVVVRLVPWCGGDTPIRFLGSSAKRRSVHAAKPLCVPIRRRGDTSVLPMRGVGPMRPGGGCVGQTLRSPRWWVGVGQTLRTRLDRRGDTPIRLAPMRLAPAADRKPMCVPIRRRGDTSANRHVCSSYAF